MLVETIFLALIIGAVCYKRFDGLLEMELKAVYLPMLAFLLEAFSGIMLKTEGLLGVQVLRWTFWIHVMVYMLLFTFVYINRHYKALIILGIGFGLNFLVIVVNQGFMPVDLSMAISQNYREGINALENNRIFGHKVLEVELDRLIILADWINIPPPYLWPKTISLGDIVIDIGVFGLIYTQFGKFKSGMKKIENV